MWFLLCFDFVDRPFLMVCLFMHSHLLQNKFINGITFVCWNLFLRFIRMKQEKRIRSCVKMNQFAESLFWLMTHLTEQFLTLCNHFLILVFFQIFTEFHHQWVCFSIRCSVRKIYLIQFHLNDFTRIFTIVYHNDS